MQNLFFSEQNVTPHVKTFFLSEKKCSTLCKTFFLLKKMQHQCKMNLARKKSKCLGVHHPCTHCRSVSSTPDPPPFCSPPFHNIIIILIAFVESIKTTLQIMFWSRVSHRSFFLNHLTDGSHMDSFERIVPEDTWHLVFEVFYHFRQCFVRQKFGLMKKTKKNDTTFCIFVFFFIRAE